MNSNWNYPTTMWVGKDRIKDLSTACKTLNINKPLLVTDSGLAKSKIVIDVLNNLKEDGITAELYSDVVGNPTGTNVTDGADYYNKNNCDGVIAFGGGSGLDVGKAIAFMSGQTLPIWDFEDVGDNWTKANSDKIAPIIAVPTTAGTGSETGRASVILNEETGVKNIIFHPKFLPSIVILDPVLTVGLPSKLTAATGMDALAHNLEAYCAPGYHPMADGIALEGIRIINEWLLEAVNNGSNIEAEYQSPDYDYGDLGTLKTLDYAKIAFTPEGDAQPTLRVRFDYDSLDTPQPADVILTEIPEPAIFGKALFGAQRFGATEQPLVRQALTGSGHSNFFKIFSADTNAPYAINGLYVNYRPSGRQ
mgnify:CR=1 FL=1